MLMVIDADDDLSAADRALIAAAAQEVATLLVGERTTADAALAADDALVADLLGLDPAARDRAVATLAARSPDLRPSRSLQVVALRADTADREHAEVALRHAVHLARRTGLATVSGPAAAVVRYGGPHAEELVAAANELAAGRFTCVAGVGPRVAGLEEAWTSHRHAELATRAVPHLAPGPVVEAAALGAYDLLLRIPDLDPTALPAPVAALLAADPRGVLVRTLEAYLRHAGSAPAAADELHVHRTTLHYRLDRIRGITGCDPDDGGTRLLLHLGLGVARLLGLLAREQTVAASPAPRP
jgi:sugar diacid utilization regulator